MTPLRQIPRLLRIAATLVRYRLDDLVEGAHLFRAIRWLRPLLPRPRADVAQLSRGARLREALTGEPELLAAVKDKLMVDRLGQPDDIAWCAVYLASEEAAYVTGADIRVDGGALAW